MNAPLPSCAGAVLAGGASTRMGDGPKGLMSLAGKPMIQHVIERFKPQVGSFMISVGVDSEAYGTMPYSLVEDLRPSHRGPLVGLYSCLQRLNDRLDEPWLAVCPCDAPFLPLQLVEMLLGAATQAGVGVAVAKYEGHVQPTFSVWRRDTLAEVRIRVMRKAEGGLMKSLGVFPHATVEWPSETIPPFFNVNEAEDAQQAEAWLQEPGAEP